MKSERQSTTAGGSPPAEHVARLASIDAMRGIAASAVVFHHLQHNTVLEPVLRTLYPAAIERVFQLGARGVHVFFVLSGFVLLYSLRSLPLDRTQAGRFILRRQARLDPPYWAMIAFALVMLVAEKLGGTEVDIPNVGAVLLNLTYLQVYAGVDQVIGVAWTLAVEIQFYLFLMLVLYSLRRWGTTRPGAPAGWPTGIAVVLFTTGAASAVLHRFHPTHQAFFGVFWMFFALGGLVCLAWSKQAAWWWAVGLAVWSVAITLPSTEALEPALVGLGTAAAVTAGVTVASGWRLWRNPVLAYLGSRSYSIYLVHLPVISAVMRTGFKITDSSRAGTAFWAVLALGATLAISEVLHRFVERPSLVLAAAAKRAGWPGLRAAMVEFLPRRAAASPTSASDPQPG